MDVFKSGAIMLTCNMPYRGEEVLGDRMVRRACYLRALDLIYCGSEAGIACDAYGGVKFFLNMCPLGGTTSNYLL